LPYHPKQKPRRGEGLRQINTSRIVTTQVKFFLTTFGIAFYQSKSFYGLNERQLKDDIYISSVLKSGGFFFSLPGLHGLAVDENGMTGPAQDAHKLIHDPTGHPCTIGFTIISTKLGMT
jgi:hypothetical protein